MKLFIKIAILAIALFVFSLHQTYSQNQEFIAGIFFNANGIHIEGDNYIFWQRGEGSIWGSGGFSGGVYVKRYINHNFYLDLEIRFIQKGSTYKYLNQYATDSYEVFRLNYLEVPLQVGWAFHTQKNEYYLETGLGFAHLFLSKMKVSDFAERNYYPNAENFKNFDLSWIASFKFPLNPKRKKNFLIGARFSYSLLSIHRNYNLRNMAYGIQLDYLFMK